MTQDELAAMIANKDERAFTYLYDRYSRSLFAVISNLIKDDKEAEDALQETFVKIWTGIDSYSDSKGRFYTWMLNVARTTAIEKLQSKGLSNSRKDTPSQNFVRMIDNGSFANMINAIGIRDFVKKLKPKCIQLIELLYFRGYTPQETSDELEMPLASVKSQNRNCISDLRNYLQI